MAAADGDLRRRHALNVLGTGALAAAVHLDAAVAAAVNDAADRRGPAPRWISSNRRRAKAG